MHQRTSHMAVLLLNYRRKVTDHVITQPLELGHHVHGAVLVLIEPSVYHFRRVRRGSAA